MGGYDFREGQVLISDRRLLRNVELSPLGIEPLMLAGPTTSRLDPSKPVGIEALSGLPLLFYRPPNYLRLLIETALRRRGLVFHVAVELETLPLMLELIVWLLKTRFERIDGVVRQGLDTRQCLRIVRLAVCRARPS
jgi:DNA-binding transcriptional LysR family regulator